MEQLPEHKDTYSLVPIEPVESNTYPEADEPVFQQIGDDEFFGH